MAEINWGMIKTGECFEALMHSLVFAEDNKAKLMDRPGKDKAVDALSGDGLTVYQAKYSANMTMDSVIALAESEMGKIKGYRDANDVTWTKVEKWVLYANVPLNTWDNEKWKSFHDAAKTNVGLETECRGIAHINQILIDHPAIRQAFFEKENRCLLYAQEAYLKLEEQSFKGCFFKTPNLIGRERELAKLKETLKNSEVRIVVVGGGSAVGKTRFLYDAMIEVGLETYRAYWGLAESMLHSSSWFECINLGDESIVFIDDCESSELVKLVLNQLSGSGTEKIKVVLGVSDADNVSIAPILRRTAKVAHIHLDTLTQDDMCRVVKSYDAISARPEFLDGVVRMSGGRPGWAAFILAACHGADSSSIMQIARDVLHEQLSNVSSDIRVKARLLLRWIALWGKLNLDKLAENGVLSYLVGLGFDEQQIQDICRLLAASDLLVRSRVNSRAFRVFNRIIRNVIILEWLVDLEAYESEGKLYLNPDGKDLILGINAGKVPLLEHVLDTLARMSLTHLTGRDAESLLGPVLAAVITELKDSTSISALQEINALKIAEIVGACDPVHALEIVKFVLTTEGSVSPVNGWSIEVKYEDAQAQAINVAVTLAKTIDEEAPAVLYFKFLLEQWQNDEIKCAIKDIITSSRPHNPYHKITFEYLIQHLEKVHENELLQEMIGWMFNLELSRIYSSLPTQFRLERARVMPGTELWEYRSKLREWLLSQLGVEEDSDKRIVYWRLLAKEHVALTFLCFDYAQKGVQESDLRAYIELIESDMEAVYNCYSKRRVSISIDEIVAIKAIWERHLKFPDKNDKLVTLAMKCEELYKNSTQFNVQDFYDGDADDELLLREREKIVRRFLNVDNQEFFDSYFKSAEKFLIASSGDGTYDHGRTEELAIECWKNGAFSGGLMAETAIMTFCRTAIEDYAARNHLVKEFVAGALRLMICDIKKDGGVDEAKIFSERILGLCGSQSDKVELWKRLYMRGNAKATGELLEWEFDTLNELSDDLSSHDIARLAPPYYQVCGAKVLGLLDEIINAEDDLNKSERIIEIALFTFYVACFQETIQPDKTLIQWFLDKVLTRKIRVNLFYSHHFESIVDKSGYRYPISDLKKIFDSNLTFDTGTDVSKYFDAGDDKNTFFELCRWVVTSGFNPYLRRYSLPQFLARLEGDRGWTLEFVKEALPSAIGNVSALTSLGLFAGAWANTSSQWESIASLICKAAKSLDEKVRPMVYSSLNPRMFTWGGELGRIAPELINRLKRAESHRDALPIDDPLRGYWEFEVGEAEHMIEMDKIQIEEVHDE